MVQQGGLQMTNINYPRLWKRKNSSYYIRVAVPRHLTELAFRKEIKYSLFTKDYRVAIKRYRKLSFIFDKFIEFLEILNMKIVKSSKPYDMSFDEYDIDNVLIYRIEEIQKFCMDYFNEINEQIKTYYDLTLFKTYSYEDLYAGIYLLKYIDWFANQDYMNSTTQGMAEKVKNGDTIIPTNSADYFLRKKDKLSSKDWFKSYVTQLKQVENYAKKCITDISNGKNSLNESINPKISDLLDTIQARRIERRNKSLKSQTKTKFSTLLEKFLAKKYNRSGVKEGTVDKYRFELETIFALIDKPFVNDLRGSDCKKVVDRIYCVPKNWVNVAKGRPLLDILERSPNEKTLAKKTLKSCLLSFREFLEFAKTEDILKESLKSYVELPKIKPKDVVNREEFTDDELKKIFNFDTFPSRWDIKYFPRYWVVWIGLTTGARLNEICQLSVNDIVEVNKIPCFHFREEDVLQSMKNQQSIRIVPIHKMLIDLGFLAFVRQVKCMGFRQLFFTLKYTKGNNYGGATSSWFRRYLTEIGVKTVKNSKQKVFHSFRYTFETKCIEKNISVELQNALGGWKEKELGIGQKVYGAKIKVSTKNEALQKIDFPCLNEAFKRFKEDANRGNFSSIMFRKGKKMI